MKRSRFFSVIVVAAAGLVFTGCEDVLKADADTVALRTVSVTGGEELLAAVVDPLAGTVEIESETDIDASTVDLDIKTAKTIVIPAGLTVTVNSVNASANCAIVGGESDSGEAGVLRVNVEFRVDSGAVFEVTEDANLAFDSTAAVTVDGVLTAEREDAIYSLGTASFRIGGSGSVKIGGRRTAARFITLPALGNSDKGGETGGNEDEEKDEGGQEPGPESALTANVSYVPTSDDVEWLATAWTGRGTAAETWGLRVKDMPVVYFSVSKTAAQTITVGGADAALVETAPDGETWDGAEASDTLALFRVNANKLHNGKEDGETYDEWYDSMFEGDDFQFTLNVGEDGKDGKTVTVNLRQNVDLTKAAVFIVTGTGDDRTLTRQTGITRCTGNAGGDKNYAPTFDENTEGTRLFDMLAWIDQNIDENAEYLVRVVADEEEMRPTAVMYRAEWYGSGYIPANAEPAGKIRLRGAGSTERVIKHDGSDMELSNAYFRNVQNQTIIRVYGLISLWAGGTLQLEKNITIEGNNSNAGASVVYNLIYITQAHLIMKDGSIIRNHIQAAAIQVNVKHKDYLWPRITMEGGLITGNMGDMGPIYMTGGKSAFDGFFTNTGGTVSGNFAKDKTSPRDGIYWGNTFVPFD